MHVITERGYMYICAATCKQRDRPSTPSVKAVCACPVVAEMMPSRKIPQSLSRTLASIC